MKRRTLLATLFSLLILLQTALGADLQFEGTPTYSVARSKVNLTIPKIVNNSATTSGAIYVQVWAMDAPYSGAGTFPGGYIIATKALAALRAGASYSNIVTSVPFKIPANGDFYTLIAIHEVKPNTVPIDFVNVPGQFHFVNGPQINMEGPASWTLGSNGAVLKLNVGKISNDALSGRSGTLRLELWATPAPYEGGAPQNGFMLGLGMLSPLSAGYSISNIVKVSGLRSPPGGYYYTTLIVTEFTRTGFIPRDSSGIPGTFYFGGPTGDAPKLDLQGPASWAILGNSIKLTVGKIYNPRNGSASGALQLKLYSLTEAFTGTLPQNAALMATANIGTVKGTVTNKNITRTVAFTVPPAGTNFTVIILTEVISAGLPTVDQDSYAFVSTVSLGDKKPIGLREGDPIPPTGDVAIDIPYGKSTFTISKDLINIRVPEIRNYYPAASGNLQLEIWMASTTNTNNIYRVAKRPLGILASGGFYTGINGYVTYEKPTNGGKYWVGLLLYNYIDGWPYQVHFEVFHNQVTVQ